MYIYKKGNALHNYYFCHMSNQWGHLIKLGREVLVAPILTAALSTLLKEHQKPMLTLKIQRKNFTDMLDTGANISIIRTEEWPLEWGRTMTPSRLLEINKANATKLSSIHSIYKLMVLIKL